MMETVLICGRCGEEVHRQSDGVRRYYRVGVRDVRMRIEYVESKEVKEMPGMDDVCSLGCLVRFVDEWGTEQNGRRPLLGGDDNAVAAVADDDVVRASVASETMLYMDDSVIVDAIMRLEEER